MEAATTEPLTRLYLLGLLPETAREEIETELLAWDERALDELITDVEHDLIWDYIHSRLPENEKNALESHFLLSPDRRAFLAEEKLMRALLRRELKEEHLSAPGSGGRLWGRLKSFLAETFAAPTPSPALSFVSSGSKIHATVMRVERVEGKLLVRIDRGEDLGVKTGDVYELFPRVRDANAGGRFQRESTGQITITRVSRKSATGSYVGIEPVTKGDTARARPRGTVKE